MMTDEKIKNSSELEFAVFCIENVASAMTSISSGVLSQIRSCLDASTVGIVSTTETITVRMIANAT